MILEIDDMPANVPFMLIPDAVLLPNSVLPLYIFEQKYRDMLAVCLDSHRMIGVAMVKPDITELVSEDDVHNIAGVGLIRACVGNSDGTSSLVLHGLGRFEVTEWDRSDAYWVGAIRHLDSNSDDETAELEGEILERCNQIGEVGSEILPPLKGYQPGESDPALLADVVGAALLQTGPQRQSLLEELSVKQRLRMLLDLM